MNHGAHGKFIVLGEYSVLDQGAALVVPLLDLKTTLKPQKNLKKYPVADDFRKFAITHGVTEIPQYAYSNIPPGSGLGASASFSVAMGKKQNPQGLFRLAQNLEHFFHHRSSGADVAGAILENPFIFQAGSAIDLETSPKNDWGFWISKPFPRTRSTGANVKQYEQSAPFFSVDDLAKAWASGPKDLAPLIETSSTWFDQTGRFPEPMKRLAALWLKHGALAVKPTGAGSGGCMLGLFPSRRPVPQGFLWWQYRSYVKC